MIRYSHASLLAICDAGTAPLITSRLGVQPTRIRVDDSGGRLCADDVWEKTTDYTWMLDSPKGHEDGDPTARLYALADLIEPFADRLPELRSIDGPLGQETIPWVDIVYHVTPHYPHGVTGEFDWVRFPADLMRRYGNWDLKISYESFWFDHPDWVAPKRKGWWSRLTSSLRGGK